MCEGNDVATKFAICCASLIIRLVVESARWRVNKRNYSEVSIYAEIVYIYIFVEHTNVNVYC